MATTIWRQMAELVRSWWRVDRIRVSPREGRLMRLTPDSWLEYEGEMWRVESRSVGTGPAGDFVTYRCSSEGRTGVLSVSPSADGRELIRWEISQRVVDATPDEFEVWGGTDRPTREPR